MAAEPLLLTPQAARWWRIEQALRRNACLTFNDLRDTVGGVSPATLKRDLQTIGPSLTRRSCTTRGGMATAWWPGGQVCWSRCRRKRPRSR